MNFCGFLQQRSDIIISSHKNSNNDKDNTNGNGNVGTDNSRIGIGDNTIIANREGKIKIDPERAKEVGQQEKVNRTTSSEIGENEQLENYLKIAIKDDHSQLFKSSLQPPKSPQQSQPEKQLEVLDECKILHVHCVDN